MNTPELKLTAEALLDLPIDGTVTLRDVLEYARNEGAFGVGSMDKDEETEIFLPAAQKILSAVHKDIVQAATTHFGGDACDFGEWVNDQIEE